MTISKKYAYAMTFILILIMTVVLTADTSNNKLMIILDASGSMWGQMEGKAKIQIAREVLEDVIMQLPESMEAGLVAYGHRRKGDCDDVETLVPLGRLDKTAMIAAVKEINPKGKTPMTQAVQETAESLRTEEEEVTILLVSDGKETCHDNPCEAIRTLAASGIRFVMHVVGFNVTAEEKIQLSCMAEAAGGTYFSAENVEEFKKAFSAVKETVSVGRDPGRLTLDKSVYSPMEQITVTFAAGADYASNAWVGILPADVPHGKEYVADQHELSYQYIKKRTSGTMTFKAPQKAGTYDVRMFNTDSVGVETATVSFEVEGTLEKGSLALDKKNYRPYDPVKVTFTAPDWFADNAWIGIVPADVPHGEERVADQHELVYKYIRKKTSGTMIFKAPRDAGTYDVRMFDTDNNGKETASVGFTVSGATENVSLNCAPLVMSPKESITVTFTAPATLDDSAWIGIVPSNIPHGSEPVNDKNNMAYQYIRSKTSGTMVFTAPEKPGSYDFRMNDSDSSGKEIASITFTVK